jgi:adenylate cyclase
MNKLFHRAGEVLKRNGSWAQKYIGDAVMAFWVHADRKGTRECALMFDSLIELREVFEQLNTEFDLPHPLKFGVGINTGMAVTGNMGSSAVADHTAMGDAVNKAFRLETASKEIGREVVIGQSTCDLIGVPPDVATILTTHSVLLKGYDEPEEVHGLGLDELERVVESLRS